MSKRRHHVSHDLGALIKPLSLRPSLAALAAAHNIPDLETSRTKLDIDRLFAAGDDLAVFKRDAKAPQQGTHDSTLALGFAGVGEQRASVRRVRAQRFKLTVVVPGHGRRCGIVAAQLQANEPLAE